MTQQVYCIMKTELQVTYYNDRAQHHSKLFKIALFIWLEEEAFSGTPWLTTVLID